MDASVCCKPHDNVAPLFFVSPFSVRTQGLGRSRERDPGVSRRLLPVEKPVVSRPPAPLYFHLLGAGGRDATGALCVCVIEGGRRLIAEDESPHVV